MKFTLEMDLGRKGPANAKDAIEGLMAEYPDGNLRDENGNTVGKWQIEEEPKEDFAKIGFDPLKGDQLFMRIK